MVVVRPRRPLALKLERMHKSGRGFTLSAWCFLASLGLPAVSRAAGSPPAAKNPGLGTALLAAIDARSLDATRGELELKADPNLPDASGETPLMHAVQCACDVRSLPVNVSIVQLLLDHHVKVNARDKDGKTALFYGIEGGSIPALRLLLAHGADPNAASQLGATPLSAARMLGSTAMTGLLLAAGAKPSAKAP